MDEDDDDSSSIVSSVTGFPEKGAVGAHVGIKEKQPDVSAGVAIYDTGTELSKGRRAGWGCTTLERGRDSLAVERQMASKASAG